MTGEARDERDSNGTQWAGPPGDEAARRRHKATSPRPEEGPSRKVDRGQKGRVICTRAGSGMWEDGADTGERPGGHGGGFSCTKGANANATATTPESAPYAPFRAGSSLRTPSRTRGRASDKPARRRLAPRLRRSLRHLELLTCDEATRDLLIHHLPAAAHEPVLFRYAVLALWTTWRDRETGLRVIGQSELEWISGVPFGGGHWGQDVLAMIKQHLPGFTWNEYEAGVHCRLIESDGLPAALHEIVRADLSRSADDHPKRVHAVSGRRYDKNEATHVRAETRSECNATSSPSPTAEWIQKSLNGRPPNVSSRVLTRVAEARAYVERMRFKVEVKRLPGETAGERNRREDAIHDSLRTAFLSTLRAIEDQHQPFYRYSGRGRTDRVFAHNPSALTLPRDVRRILYQGFLSVDLKSAHLFIAAALWGVDDVLEVLKLEGYSVWTDLLKHVGLGHLTPGTDEYAEAKDALKTATYSVIYGMDERAVVWTYSKAARRLAGPRAGKRLAEHWLIRRLLDARDEHLSALAEGDVLETPTGIHVVVGGDVDAKSAMATVAQAYEQALMAVVLEYERDHLATAKPGSFRVALWIHDGCYVSITRSEKKHLAKLQERLARRASELGVYARFEVERVGIPPAPERSPAEALAEPLPASPAGSRSHPGLA